MADESKTGLGVIQHYGPRNTGLSNGWEHSKDSTHRLSFEITSTGIIDGSFLPPVVMPKGATVYRAMIYVDTPITGVTALSIGRGNATATDGLVLAAADMAVGGRDVTAKLAGQWAAGSSTTTANRIGATVTGAPTTKTGRISIVLDVHYKRRVDGEYKPEAASQPTNYTPQFQV